jgi:hypothetical protein
MRARDVTDMRATSLRQRWIAMWWPFFFGAAIVGGGVLLGSAWSLDGKSDPERKLCDGLSRRSFTARIWSRFKGPGSSSVKSLATLVAA